MRPKTSYLVAAGLTLALAGWLLSGQLGSGAQQPDPATTTATTRPEAKVLSVRVRDLVAAPVEREIVVNGKTAPARAVTLRVEAGGRVLELGPERGARVRAGDLLVRLDPRERAAIVEQAEAALQMREIEHEAARKLGAKGFQSETEVAAARANLEAAQAMLEQAQIELSHTEIRAPFDGLLEERPVEVGDFLEVGDEVATVIELDPFLVVGDVAETQIGRLATGMPGSARLITGRNVQGRLRYVGSRANPDTRTFRVELEVANPDGRVAAGASAELHIVDQRVQAHRISAALLTLNDAGEVGVKAVADDDTVVFHPAQVVRGEADAVWLAGLPERLRLITVGQGFVRAGDRVKPVPEADADGSAPPGAEPQA